MTTRSKITTSLFKKFKKENDNGCYRLHGIIPFYKKKRADVIPILPEPG
jgi:hypothetical protein